MRYWKRLNGECGVMDDNDFVPDSEDATEDEYNLFVESQTVELPINQKVEYAQLTTTEERIEYIAQRLRLL